MIAEKKEVFMAGKKPMALKNSFIGKRGYGWVPDIPDQRDYLLSAGVKMGDVGAQSSEKGKGALIKEITLDAGIKGGQPVPPFPF
jgi:hypothetical protein